MIEVEDRDQEQAVSLGAVRYAAMNFLARREHARSELQQKLTRRFSEHPGLIEEALDQLRDEGLQSDERFAETFVAMRMRKGQGPVRIAAELQQRGVGQALIEENLGFIDACDWLDNARDVCQGKYGTVGGDSALKAKQMRFLQYRGFPAEIVYRLWQEAGD